MVINGYMDEFREYRCAEIKFLGGEHKSIYEEKIIYTHGSPPSPYVSPLFSRQNAAPHRRTTRTLDGGSRRPSQRRHLGSTGRTVYLSMALPTWQPAARSAVRALVRFVFSFVLLVLR